MAAVTHTAVPVAPLANGTMLNLPLLEVRGGHDGPTFGLAALIHGDEPTGLEVIYRFVQDLDASQLRGRLLILPVADPLAYEALTRNTPLDMTNLNRVFPGQRDGWLTEQIAYHITEHFLDKLDYLLDFHAGGLLCAVDYVYIHNAEDLSRAFGSPLLYRPDPSLQGTVYSGTATSYAVERGVKSVVIELGGGMTDQTAYVQRGVQGIYNVLRAAKLLPGEPAPPPPQTVVREIGLLRPTVGGMLVPEVTQMNGIVKQGQVLGRVVSPYTFETLETFTCPFEEGIMVLLRPGVSKIQPGDYLYMVGNLAGAERHG